MKKLNKTEVREGISISAFVGLAVTIVLVFIFNLGEFDKFFYSESQERHDSESYLNSLDLRANVRRERDRLEQARLEIQAEAFRREKRREHDEKVSIIEEGATKAIRKILKEKRQKEAQEVK